ncbi:MAG TPA: hypothetical protein VIP11_13010 [Gemmatimonadaceae bacterium]
MPIREFTDSLGTRWLVWATIPSPGSVLGSMRDGWLTFDSRTVRRRLMPIPTNWEEASPQTLDGMCRAAVLVRPTPPSGIDAGEIERRTGG